jgi:hypothetical protein
VLPEIVAAASRYDVYGHASVEEHGFVATAQIV